MLLLLNFFLHNHILRASHVSFKQSWLYSLITALIITEIFGSLLFWPTGFLINSLIVTVVFYVLSGISRCVLTSVLTKKLISRYMYWAGIIVSVALITAKWK